MGIGVAVLRDSMSTHQRLNYIHIFRAIAIIFIVSGHSFLLECPNKDLQILLHEMLANGTVLFVFIAGFLFQYLSDTFEYVPYLKKKFLNVIFPYFLLSSIGIGIKFLFPQTNPFHKADNLTQVFMFLTTGAVHNIATWYIPVICLFFWQPSGC